VIAVGLVMSLIFGGGIGRAHERLSETPSEVVDGDRDDGDALEALTRRVLDHRLGADERRAIAEARQQQLAELIKRDPASVLKRAMTPSARAALPSDVQALVEQVQSHEGTLQVLHADGPQGGAYLYNLVKPSGERLSLHFASDGSGVLTGARVRVRGVRVQQALAVGGSAEMTLLGSPTLPSTFGAHRVLIIRIEFQNAPGVTTQTAAQVQDVAFGTGIASVTELFREASYQQMWITGDVIGPLVIPLANTGCNYDLIGSLARTAASLTGLLLGQYNHLVYAFPSVAACGWGGLGTVGGSPGEAWINGAIDTHVLGHELGHHLGLYHSHALECGTVAIGGSCSTVEYGDGFDTMGLGYTYHFNAVQKDLLGWLGYGGSPPITGVQSSGTYTLDRYETPGTNPKALKVQTSAGDWLYVEYRTPTGFDSGVASYPNVTSGVLVHYWNGDGNGVYLLDMTPATSSWQDPALTVGNTFAYTAGGVSITPVWIDGTTAGVNVTVGTACVRRIPSTSVAPVQQAGAAGTPLAYTVSVRNNDTGCGTSSFTLSVTAPSGWSATLAGGSMSLGQGATGTTTLQLISPATAAPAAYAAVVVAAGATLSSSASAGYVANPPIVGGGGGVGAPGTFSDSFDRLDSPELGNGWSTVSGTLMIVSGEARSQAMRVLHMSVRPNLGGATQTVGASFASVDNNTAPKLGVVLRYQDLSNYYRCYRSVGGVSVVRIVKLVNGKETVLKSVAMANPLKNVPFTLSCGVSGTSLTLSIDGVTKASAVDSTFASGSVGFALSSSSGTGASHRSDNFSATLQ
jgi:hypothetical protein